MIILTAFSMAGRKVRPNRFGATRQQKTVEAKIHTHTLTLDCRYELPVGFLVTATV